MVEKKTTEANKEVWKKTINSSKLLLVDRWTEHSTLSSLFSIAKVEEENNSAGYVSPSITNPFS